MDIDAFIAKWSLGEGGAERANAAMYTVEMLQALGLPAPDPACATSGPAASADLARRFSGGARLEPRISRVLTTLHRYGHVDRLPDGRWTASRAA